MLRLESSWHGRSVDHVLTYSGRQIAVDLRNLHELRGKRLVAQVSETRRFALYSRAGVVLMLRLESSWHGRSMDHVLTYSGRQIAVDLRNLHELRGKRVVAQERGSCLNIFRTKNLGRISETFTNYEVKDLLRKSVDHVLTYFERQIAIGSQKPYELRGRRLDAQVSQTRRNFTNYEAKELLRESNTSVRVVFANRSGFDAPLESSWRGRSMDQVLTYSGRQIAVGSQKLHELQGKRLVAQVSQTRRFALYLRTGVVLMLQLESSWHGRSLDNIFRTKNHGRISETFTNYEAKDLLRKSVDHVLTYSGRKIEVGSQKPSRITSQKTCSASESNTSVRVVFANRSGFDAPIGVVLAREERGSCLTYSGRQIAVGSQKLRITRQKTCCASE
ncbi:uncharacterized protein G2W53_009848 [Senna tora]|uniref:Uncharacterized protein n=1 Tax=Senna tora TaxID=362788 RepID=A0A835C8V4_9FABA|nr:uncharacterized protein G2W53_009848 [Senna tora]